MRVAPPVKPDNSQRIMLEQWARSRSLPARQVERARIVLLAAEGKSDLEIAAALGVSNQKAARLAQAVLGVRLGGVGEGRATFRTQTRHHIQRQRRVDPQDHRRQA